MLATVASRGANHSEVDNVVTIINKIAHSVDDSRQRCTLSRSELVAT